MAKKENVSETCEVNYLHFPGQERPYSPKDDKFVSMNRAMEILGLERQAIQDLIDSGVMAEVRKRKFPPVRWSFRESDLIDFAIKYDYHEDKKTK